jgi:hypothetical protein
VSEELEEAFDMNGHKLVSLTIAALVVACMAAGQAFGGFVQYDVTNSGYDDTDNWWVYSYILDNPVNAPDNVYWFELPGLSGNLGPEPVPMGWSMVVSGTTIDWTANFDPTWDYATFGPEYEIRPGQDLPGFAFHSSDAPGSVSYHLLGASDLGVPTGLEYDGPTVGPAPEPTSLALFFVGLLPLGLARWWRRKS